MNVHAHIVKAHMVIGAVTECTRQQFSLQGQAQQPTLFVSLSVQDIEEWPSVKLSIYLSLIVTLMVISSNQRKPSICLLYQDSVYCIKFLLQQIKNYFTGFVHVRSKYCSLTNSARHICIARSWKLRFAMITSVRAKLFTGSSGKTSLHVDLSKCFSRIGCWAYGGWLYCYTT